MAMRKTILIALIIIVAMAAAAFFLHQQGSSPTTIYTISTAPSTTVKPSISEAQAKAYALPAANVSLTGIHYGFERGVLYTVSSTKNVSSSSYYYSLVMVTNTSQDAQNIFTNYTVSFFDKVVNTSFAGGTRWLSGLPVIGNITNGILLNSSAPGSPDMVLILQFTYNNIYAKVELTAPHNQSRSSLQAQLVNMSETLLSSIKHGAFTN